MKPQLSQNYNVDNRYRGLEAAQDNVRGRQFVDNYIARKRSSQRPNLKGEEAGEGRFVFDGGVEFRNLFRAKQ